MNLTPTEYSVLKALDTERWRTTLQIANELKLDSLAVAQALYYLHLNGKVERKEQRDGLSKWRKR